MKRGFRSPSDKEERLADMCNKITEYFDSDGLNSDERITILSNLLVAEALENGCSIASFVFRLATIFESYGKQLPDVEI